MSAACWSPSKPGSWPWFDLTHGIWAVNIRKIFRSPPFLSCPYPCASIQHQVYWLQTQWAHDSHRQVRWAERGRGKKKRRLSHSILSTPPDPPTAGPCLRRIFYQPDVHNGTDSPAVSPLFSSPCWTPGSPSTAHTQPGHGKAVPSMGLLNPAVLLLLTYLPFGKPPQSFLCHHNPSICLPTHAASGGFFHIQFPNVYRQGWGGQELVVPSLHHFPNVQT